MPSNSPLGFRETGNHRSFHKHVEISETKHSKVREFRGGDWMGTEGAVCLRGLLTLDRKY